MTKLHQSRRQALKGVGVAAAAGLLGPRFGAPAWAQAKPEIDTVVLAPQFGLAYLPMHVMKQLRLVEKHLAANGLPNSKVEWRQTGGGAAANEALLSGNVHFVSGGIGPLLTIWDRTKGNADVKGVGTFDTTSLYLNTINPAVKTLKDFTDKDRIAMPAVKVSIQAVTLQMACEQAFGAGKHEQLDHLTVSMPHPDAQAAMLSGKAEITAHFSGPPFQFQQLEDSRVRKVIGSFEVLGGPTTFNSMYTSAKIRNDNPRSYKAVFEALVEAHEIIAKNRADAIKIYIDEEKSRLTPEFIAKMLSGGEVNHTIVPRNTIKYAEFMNRIGRLKNKAQSWQDYYFPEVHGTAGS